MVSKKKLESKSRKNTHFEFDDALLNASLPWYELVEELLHRNCTLYNIAARLGCSVEVIQEIQQCCYENLNFRAGALLVTMHYEYCRELYPE